ncbi:ribosomal RNA small subunit methyltransferase H [Acetobacter cibinongensis]|uniref:Ribosomal RNA small subunit methyltransferase H n=1 Tax=Acetobacter cibinongensis TaxID=146475 RepID=A0A0D6N2J9_9PROT|nr:16S rRNA (cytosine(1402)-N(4))-methyltransferase RsmH [Acetobacter cibinongensis]GAN59940.1 S-adenosyl-methyltransferase MraW/16S rRNA methyltransferase H [Acetobacter cibinongensis]GBQ16392.1 S-adenosyl-methyltransferase MraW [Acetobacter cibinongensis NRIC 0482]GEL57560.1 ribosomal RNA small subunit methyltransferase H [Acetobacter cibinongensis]
MNAMTHTTPAIGTSGHVPVMLTEVLEALKPEAGDAILDCTFGGGGYTTAILNTSDCTVWGIDRDPDAIARGEALAKAFEAQSGKPRLHMLHGGFGSMQRLAEEAEAPAFNGIVLDLGVSSFQLDEAERGFSFKQDGPLDMRMAKSGPTAADIVNKAPEAELADIFHFYGEERQARRVARAIVADRVETPFTSTLQLAGLIRRVVRADRSGIDSATRSFQGLRIAVNDELGEIERGLEQALDLLAPGGRLVVVSFHSLEDRIAKRVFGAATGKTTQSFSRYDPRAAMSRGDESPFVTLTHKPVRPGEAECLTNPRARSARLRAIAKRNPDASSCDKGLNP